MSNHIDAMMTMVVYAIKTLNESSGHRYSVLRGIVKGDNYYRVHMGSLSSHFCEEEAAELTGRSVQIDDINYMITFKEGWFLLNRLRDGEQ